MAVAIVSGQKLGTYSIGDSIGVGGMGEVFRGTDEKLNRSVAIKVLPESFAKDEDRVARFQLEAKLLAALNHPNIAQIYGIEELEDSAAIIMELVEGPTLADRIAERPLSPDEAMGIAYQVINALEAAHEQHIVHRDLKPANIKLREDGTVKVLDFGIAKPLDARAISGGNLAPSLTTPALTESGLIMGTAAYMSPEQARGKRVDERTDIWAFACVLYEMLTGQPAFGGDDITVTLARVIERDVNYESIPSTFSPAVRHTLRLCLMKDPKQRIADIRDVRLALAGEFESLDAGAGQTRRGKPVWQVALPVGLAAAVLAGVLVWLISLPGQQPAQPGSDVIRYDLPVVKVEGDTVLARFLGGDDAQPGAGRPFFNALAFSHDGSMLAYSAWAVDENRNPEAEIVLNRLNQNRPVPVAGTAMGSSPFFSPDDEWLGFYQNNAIKRVSLASGNIETILSDTEMLAFGILGAHWLDDGTIVFGAYPHLYRIQDNGSSLEQLSPDAEADFDYPLMPRMLPGGNTVMFHTVKSGRRPEDGEVRALDLASGNQTVILADAQQPWYLPEIGQLLFVRQGTLMAIAFDPVTLATQGSPLVVVEGVAQAYRNGAILRNSGVAQFDISAAGHLAYAPGGVFPKPDKQSIRVTPEGHVDILITESFNFLSQRVSPDGARIAFADMYGPDARLYVHERARGVTRPLTNGTGFNMNPIWSPDGKTILYTANSDGLGGKMYVVPADGSEEPEPLLPSDLDQIGASWSSKGTIAFLGIRPRNRADAGIWVMDEGREPLPFIVAEDSEQFPTFSPDGNWLLYTSVESDIPQVNVRPYPELNPLTRISQTGGIQPAWSKDGRAIFYRARIAEEGQPPRIVLMKADFTPGNPPVVGRPEPYIDPFPFAESTPVRLYDVMEDGSIITAATEQEIDAFRAGREPRSPAEEYGIREIKVVHNFVAELSRRLAQ